MTTDLSGTGVALVTPFNDRHEVDFEALGRLVEYTVSNGVDFLVSLGTTGESATLSFSEKQAVLEFTIKKAAGKVPVVAGAGGNNTAHVIHEMHQLNLDGVAAFLSVSPYYNKPSQEGIYRHYKALSEATDKPIILYNVPGRTSSNILPETVLQLASDCKNIIAVKEASGNLVQCMEIVRGRPEGFLVLSGDDALTLPMITIGMDGVISVAANIFPGRFSKMIRLARQGEWRDAQIFHYSMLNMMDLLFREGNPAGVKAALKHMGICEEHMRLPLYPVSDSLREAIGRELSTLTGP